MKNSIWIVATCFILVTVVVGFPVYRYWIHFGSMLPDDTAVWGQLGDFLNVWVSIASLILLSGLTYTLHSIDRKRQDKYSELEASRNRPYLVIRYNLTHGKYVIKNVGMGPALNTISSFKLDGNWQIPLQMHSIMSGEEIFFPMRQPTNESEIAIVYFDFQESVISTLFDREVNKILVDQNLLEDIKGGYSSLETAAKTGKLYDEKGMSKNT